MPPTGIVLYHGIDSGPELAGFDSLWVTERSFHEETSSMLGYLAFCLNGDHHMLP